MKVIPLYILLGMFLCSCFSRRISDEEIYGAGLVTAMNTGPTGYYDNRQDWEKTIDEQESEKTLGNITGNAAVQAGTSALATGVAYRLAYNSAYKHISPKYYRVIQPTLYNSFVGPLRAIGR